MNRKSRTQGGYSATNDPREEETAKERIQNSNLLNPQAGGAKKNDKKLPPKKITFEGKLFHEKTIPTGKERKYMRYYSKDVPDIMLVMNATESSAKSAWSLRLNKNPKK